MTTMLASALLALALLAPQGGYTKEKHPELGIDFPRAKSYEAVPIPPNWKYTVLSFAEKIQKEPKELRPELDFIRIDWAPDPDPPAAEGSTPITTFERAVDTENYIIAYRHSSSTSTTRSASCGRIPGSTRGRTTTTAVRASAAGR